MWIKKDGRSGTVIIDGNPPGIQVDIVGHLTKSTGSFVIDHPLDPANKLLEHSFVESPDMKNIYDGVVVLNEDGGATIDMPDWFEALNKDFRYQLTPIGTAAPNLHIAQEMQEGTFRIAGGNAGQRISWQVTGIRQDPAAKAHPVVVERQKGSDEKGTYRYKGYKEHHVGETED